MEGGREGGRERERERGGLRTQVFSYRGRADVDLFSDGGGGGEVALRDVFDENPDLAL